MVMTNEQLRERMNSRSTPTSELLNTEILEIDQDAGTVRMAFDIGDMLCNPNGTVQGGIIATMLDDAAATSAIAKGKKRMFVPSLELKVSYFRPAPKGRLYANGRCVKLGRKIAFMEADLVDGDDRLLARLSMTGAPVDLEKPKLVERS
ncbi:MAG: PaaI family thioesterase [Pacificimonas sp.]|jgi:uncharacterized protein (TIGR00369 family)|nr:PaaI family thioesterase [Pacificimonas sp.]